VPAPAPAPAPVEKPAPPPATKPAAPKPVAAPQPSDPAAVRAMVTERLEAQLPSVQSCGSSAKGRWRLTFSVLPSGGTGGVEVVALDQPDAAVESCVAGQVSGWRFEPIAQAQPVSRTLRFP
jgi:hypothetical protein